MLDEIIERELLTTMNVWRSGPKSKISHQSPFKIVVTHFFLNGR